MTAKRGGEGEKGDGRRGVRTEAAEGEVEPVAQGAGGGGGEGEEKDYVLDPGGELGAVDQEGEDEGEEEGGEEEEEEDAEVFEDACHRGIRRSRIS